VGVTIDSFNPERGTSNLPVTVIGKGFTNDGRTAVYFTGSPQPAASEILDPMTLVAHVPADATTGPITVAVCGMGSAASSSDFVVVPEPMITGFEPTSGAVGTRVTLSGSGLGDVTAVLFWNQGGGKDISGIAGLNLATGTQVTVEVPEGATFGPLMAIASSSPDLIVSTSSFTALAGAAPSIDHIDPSVGGAGYDSSNARPYAVTIFGSHLTGTTSVRFSGSMEPIDSQYTALSDAEIVADIPYEASSGPITVTNDTDSAVTGEFQVVPIATIASATPSSLQQGQVLTLTGTDLLTTSAVTFGLAPAIAAPFTVSSDTELLVTIPGGAISSSVINVRTAAGLFTYASRLVIEPGPDAPTITGFWPTSGGAGIEGKPNSGTLVTLTGTGFTGTSSIQFNGTEALVRAGKGRPSSVSFLSDSELTVYVPALADTGLISLTALGTTTTAGLAVPNFTVLPKPTITAIDPSSAPPQMMVTIRGTNLAATTSVVFLPKMGGAGGPAIFFADGEDLVVTVPAMEPNDVTITVTTPAGTAMNDSAPFAVEGFPPTITGFSPASGAVGDPITITGTGFGRNFNPLGTGNQVKFNGTEATSFNSDDTDVCGGRFIAYVPDGASTGPITATTPWGSASTQSLEPSMFTVIGPDAGEPDAGAAQDASVIEQPDAGEVNGPDAAVALSSDAGTNNDSSGCGCSSTRAAPGALMLGLLAFGLVAARRRRLT
jgi:MYXO-CTERM domain-containing protein